MIDFKFIVGILIAKRKRLFFFMVIFTILGVVVAQISEDEYTSKSLFIPKGTTPTSAGSGRLRNLASIAGFNLGSVAEETNLHPQLYGKITATIDFRLKLANTLVTIPGRTEKVTYIAYYRDYYKPSTLGFIKKYTIGLPKLLLRLIRGQSEEKKEAKRPREFDLLSAEERINIARLKTQIAVSYNELGGYVELSANMPDPLIAAQMAKSAESILQNMIIDHRLKNVREELKFTRELLQEKREKYEESLEILTLFQDSNQSINTASGLSRLQKIQGDFDLAYNVYSQIASQYEQVKLQMAKDTPVFSIIEPVSLPARPSAPRKSLIILVFIFLGMLTGLTLIFGRLLIEKLKGQYTKELNSN